VIAGVAPPAIERGWLRCSARMPSPNCDDRPAGMPIDLIIIHNISLPPGRYGGGHVERFFCNELDVEADPYFSEIADLRVSAHLLIERGGATTQFVPFDQRAWHAGLSEFEGRPRCNDFSIGIELEGTDFEPFADAQYAALNSALAALVAAYPIRALRGHSDVAPGRKTDPGPFFQWDRLVVPPSILRPQLRA
jgi:N-acetyl-anhydromuramoyl-L-alanine amidase